MKKTLLISLTLASSLLCGCAMLDDMVLAIGKIGINDKVPQIELPSTPIPTTTTTTVPPVASGDAVPWSSIEWYGQNKAVHAVPTKVLRSATVYGDMRVMLDYDTNANWPECKVIPGCRSSFMVFTVIDGKLQGGHSDHMRLNAKQRDLDNFYTGYLMQNVPRGQDLYIAIASHDGKERSNIVKATRK